MSKQRPAKPAKKPSGGPIPATRDTFVHYLFGTRGNEDILLDFVNAVLENDDRPLAQSVEMRNPFNPATFITDKYTILDVKATDQSGEIFVIEFQTTDRTTFANRMLYYCGKAYCAQMTKGDSYSALHPVIGIAIITYVLIKHIPSPHNPFYMTAKADPNFVLTDGIQMHVLEIVKEKVGRFATLKPALRRWADFFYYADKKSEAEMKVLSKESSTVQRAYEAYKTFCADAKMRALDEAHQRYLHDYNTDLEAAHNKGVIEGELKGELKGRVDATLVILRARFKRVPKHIVEALNKRTDLTAMESLLVLAAQCESLDIFADALK